MSDPINRLTMLRGTLESLLHQLTNYPPEFMRETALFCEDHAGVIEDMRGALQKAQERDWEALRARKVAA